MADQEQAARAGWYGIQIGRYAALPGEDAIEDWPGYGISVHLTHSIQVTKKRGRQICRR